YFQADRHLAASMSIDTPAGELKAGTGWFKEESGRESLYTTLALKKDSKSFSFLTEGAVSKQSYEGGVLYDIYAQGVWHLVSKHDLIARVEKYKDVSEVESNTILVLGYTYRPKYYMALKGEVDMFKKGSPIWLISFSMMF
ncbi:MAG: hypothetical protein L3J42_05220, partial [Hydrogenimonas sp.]|nr:hypothetical protein [Hydrogenimonas sp.]